MTDIVERLRTDGAMAGHYDVPAVQRAAADEIERLRAECQRLAGEVSRAHKDALTWMERAVAARREGIEAAATEVDCGCDIRDAVLERLEAQGQKRASYLCQHGDVCCALQAAEIRALLEDGR